MQQNHKPVVNQPERDIQSAPRKLPITTTADRLRTIEEEFREGFEFLHPDRKSVTFFGSTTIGETNPYYQQAKSLATEIVSDLDYSIVTGGGPGIMEAANRGALEAGGKSYGITIELPDKQVRNPYLTASYECSYFFVRKVLLSFAARAYIFFPGGYGTLDELFEILTLVQTNKIERIPIILVGNEYWLKWEEFVKTELLDKYQTIQSQDIDLYRITDNVDEILEMIATAPERIS